MENELLCLRINFDYTDSSDEGDISSGTLNSSLEQVDLSQRASVTSADDLDLDIYSKSTKQKSSAEKIEEIIRRRGDDSSDPRHSKPTDCDLIALQKVKVSILNCISNDIYVSYSQIDSMICEK